MLLTFAPVQTDKTRESIQEIIKEFQAIVADKPVTQEEYDRNKDNVVMQLPGRWETTGSVCFSLLTISKYGLPLDYYKSYDKNVRNLSLLELRNLSDQILVHGKLNWFIVGDKNKIMDSIKSMGFSEIVLVDADGNPL